MRGDEAKIMEKIQQWWDEPVIPTEEEKWEDVNKKTIKKKQDQAGGAVVGSGRGGRGGRSQGSGGGGGGRGRSRDRGGGRGERVVRERHGKGPRNDKRQPALPQSKQTAEQDVATDGLTPSHELKGAWGARAGGVAPNTSVPQLQTPTENSLSMDLQEPLMPPPTSLPELNHIDTFPVNQSPHIPSHAIETMPVVRASVPRVGNVWATKGSAHLIQAEKQPLVPMHAPSPAPVPPISQPLQQPVIEKEPPSLFIADSTPSPALETGLQVGVPGSGHTWSQSPKPSQPVPEPTHKSVEMPPPPSPAVSRSIAPPSPAAVPPPEPVLENLPEPLIASPAVQKVLNMGHWETGGGDDPSDIDFGFGYDGGSNDATAPPTASTESSTAPAGTTSASATAVSPARPPPGLSISVMPPMPATAVMVHELENSLESASLNAPVTKSDPPPPAPIPAPLTAAQSNHATPSQTLPSGITHQTYNQQQYGMPSMYNYNAATAGSGFVGMPGPVLTGGVVPQHNSKPQATTGLSGPTQNAPPQILPQQGLYGAQPSAAPHTPIDSTTTGENALTSTGPSGAVPPGMAAAIPYANPALHYSQHQFYMGQHQGGIGYNYGYGQFGGVAQGGFGYQPSMAHNQGYGAPHYDDQGHQSNSHHTAGSGGYQSKGGGGYRARNTHHNNNQYQNQYTPQQHGGYGGQPYGMGYHGHGPGGMGDPYSMQHQGGMGGAVFQDDEHQKGRKGVRGGNNSFQQGPQQLGGQQPFGLQQHGGVDSAPSSGGGGWSNQGGGWSGGGQSGWQGN
jgi:hypothetical protein